MDHSSPTEQRDRPGLIKSIRRGAQRIQIAIYLMAIVGMALLINGIMNGFGGGGSSEAIVSVNDTSSQVILDQPSRVDEEQANGSSPQKIMKILIDDEDYFLELGTELQKITLDEIAEQIKDVPGDANGIKVIVSRKKSARELAHIQLRETLDSLISPEAQRWPDELIE